MNSKSKILKVSLSKDRSKLIFKDPFNKNRQVGARSVYDYRPAFIEKLPCYCDCVIDGNRILIRNISTVVSKREWASIPNDYKGAWSDFHGDAPEFRGRRTVLGGCLNPSWGTSLLIEGVHFIVER